MGHAVRGEIRGECPREVGGPVVAEQPRPMHDLHAVDAGVRPSEVERLGGIASLHRGPEQPGRHGA